MRVKSHFLGEKWIEKNNAHFNKGHKKYTPNQIITPQKCIKFTILENNTPDTTLKHC